MLKAEGRLLAPFPAAGASRGAAEREGHFADLGPTSASARWKQEVPAEAMRGLLVHPI